MNFKYQAAIARAFGKFVEQDLVYKGKKPVHWCIHCRTALAEAEVEYEDHTSPSIYVEFPLAPESGGGVRQRACRRSPAATSRSSSGRRRRGRFRRTWRSRSIRTSTTPRTTSDGRAVIVAEALAPKVAAAGGKTFGEPLARMKGAELEHIRFQHPLYARTSLGVLGDYVTLDAGTGAVHTAPGHGADDFNTGMQLRPRDLRADRPGRTLPRHGRAVRRAARVRREPERRSRRSRSAAGCGTARRSRTRIRTAGAATTR